MVTTHVEIMESIGRLSLALLLGSVIGFERQWNQKMAGLRTNALVALGSCGFVVFSSKDAETYYTVTLTCNSAQEAHLRSLLLHALSQGGLGLRRIDSSDVPDTSKVVITRRPELLLNISRKSTWNRMS